jgi:hypothetical protein
VFSILAPLLAGAVILVILLFLIIFVADLGGAALAGA